MVFLISPDSYFLKEMQFARDWWRHAAGRVLPVIAATAT